MQLHYFTIENLSTSTRDEFEKIKRNKQQLLLDAGTILVWSVGEKRIAYLFHDGKYYKGDMAATITTDELSKQFDFLGIRTQAPMAVFRRRRDMTRSPAAEAA